MAKVFNISSSHCFSDVLAQKFCADYANNPFGLTDILFLLPNRRACQSLAEAFVRQKGMEPTLLPQMMAIGDTDEDDLMLQGSGLDHVLEDVLPAMDRQERLMLFIKIIMAKPGDFGLEKMSLNQACYLAQELAGLIDTVHNENLDFKNLQNLVPEEYASHWQETLKFLEIITRFWPDILQERNLMDASLRKKQLLEKQCLIWKTNPPDKKIVVAGTTATFPVMKELVKTVLDLPQGELILSGLDKYLDDASWEEVDETHPQFELKELLSFLKIKRQDVVDFVLPRNVEREKLFSEVMRPAKTTDQWRWLGKKGLYPEAWGGLRLLNCKDIREEALAIALIMREVLETPEKTAALVTPDRNLARRVAAELERWNICVDDSAGRPLSLTPVGIFLRLVVAAALLRAGKIDLLSLLKHPLCGMGKKYAEIRRLVRNLEKNVWREGKEDDEAKTILQDVSLLYGYFGELCRKDKVGLKELICEHIRAAERLASLENKKGEELLWKGDAGEAAARFIADWYEKADVLGEIEVEEYLGLFEAMMAGVTVRPKYGTHPRLKILGPIEARLNHADVVILGEMNEGVWPQTASSDPWMSRPMKKDFGFPLPEKAIGVLGLDFCNLCGAEEVYLTRAERVQGTPMVKSRWLMRLETVLKALNFDALDLESNFYRLLAQQRDEPAEFVKIGAPNPCPPVEARPRELSASGIELLMRDPYSVFAKYILLLKPLKEIEQDLTMADYGTIIHGILEEFNRLYPFDFPENAKEILLKIGAETFRKNELALERRAFWWPSFEKIVDHLVALESQYRPDIYRIHSEVKGFFELEAPAGKFKVTAKADRVDETKDGKINIIDYKTGKARTPKEVEKGYAPQLPIEGLIAQKGGYQEIKAAKVGALIYWQLGKKDTVIAAKMDTILQDTEEHLQKLISLFDFETTGYICHPNPKRVPEYSDYEHLARVKEWSVQGEGDDD